LPTMHAGRLSNVYVLMHSASGPTFLAAAQDAAAGVVLLGSRPATGMTVATINLDDVTRCGGHDCQQWQLYMGLVHGHWQSLTGSQRS
jgi:hypothetical protein